MLARMAAGAEPDTELVARCRAGETAAWNELVDRFARYVQAISTQGFRLAEPDAEDVFQEVFTRVYTTWTAFGQTNRAGRGSRS